MRNNKKITDLIFESIILIISVSILLAALSIRIGLVVSESMEPTFMVGDRQIAFKLAYLMSPPQAGDVVQFTLDGDIICKRIIGEPGDTIAFSDDGRLILNGTVMNEPYAQGATLPVLSNTYSVPEGAYFVMGDNRMNSYDSRYWVNPYIKKADISAKVFPIPQKINDIFRKSTADIETIKQLNAPVIASFAPIQFNNRSAQGIVNSSVLIKNTNMYINTIINKLSKTDINKYIQRGITYMNKLTLTIPKVFDHYWSSIRAGPGQNAFLSG